MKLGTKYQLKGEREVQGAPGTQIKVLSDYKFGQGGASATCVKCCLGRDARAGAHVSTGCLFGCVMLTMSKPWKKSQGNRMHCDILDQVLSINEHLAQKTSRSTRL